VATIESEDQKQKRRAETKKWRAKTKAKYLYYQLV